jgi:hypothetical protein
VLFLDEAPELREISEEDWEMIEHLAELSNQRGDVYTSGTVTASRAMQICEMPGAAILSIVVHLAYLRRDDLVDSLEVADLENLLTDEILKRKEYDLQRLDEFQGRQQKRRTPRTHQRRSREQMDQAWAACLADPRAAVERMRAVIASHTDGHQGGAEQDLARLLGVGLRGGWREELQAKQLQLVELAEAAAVEPGEALAAEAMDWRDGLPTAQSAINAWQRRQQQPEQDWREWFRHGSCFQLGETAIRSIASAVGVSVEEVQLHAAQVEAREDLQLRQVEAAYVDAAELLRDAREAGGWGWLGTHLELPPWMFERRYAEITGAQVSRPG